MKLLGDEGVDAAIVARLRADNHDVVSVAELTPGITDEAVLELANGDERVLLTTDKARCRSTQAMSRAFAGRPKAAKPVNTLTSHDIRGLGQSAARVKVASCGPTAGQRRAAEELMASRAARGDASAIDRVYWLVVVESAKHGSSHELPVSVLRHPRPSVVAELSSDVWVSGGNATSLRCQPLPILASHCTTAARLGDALLSLTCAGSDHGLGHRHVLHQLQ